MTTEENRERLKSYIKAELKLSQTQLAEMFGVTQANINALLNGKTPFGKTLALAWEERLGIRAAWLLIGDGNMLKTERKEPAPVETITMPREVFDQITRLTETVSAQQIERGDFLELLKSQQRTIETFARIEEKLDNREGAVSKSRNVL